MEYNQALEFLIENGIQLNRDQLDKLYDICNESGGALKRIVDDRMDKAKKYDDAADAIEKIGGRHEITTDGGAKYDQVQHLRDVADFLKFGPINLWTDKVDASNTPIVTRKAYDVGRKMNHDGRISATSAAEDIRRAKKGIGQGKENMPKDREPGTYLKLSKMLKEENEKRNQKKTSK